MRMRKLLVILVWVTVIFLYFGGIGQSQQREVKTGTVSGYGGGPFGGKWLEIKDDDGIVYTFRVGRSTSFQPHRFPKIGERVEVHYTERKGLWIGYKVIILK